MKNNFLIQGGLAFLVLLFLAGSALAEGTLYISTINKDFAIMDANGVIMDPNAATPQFFIGSIPEKPGDTAGMIPPADYSKIIEGNDVKFTFAKPEHRGKLFVRIWDGINYNQGSDGYELPPDTTKPVPMNLTFPAPGKYYLKGLQASYEAGTPNKPASATLGLTGLTPDNLDGVFNVTYKIDDPKHQIQSYKYQLAEVVGGAVDWTTVVPVATEVDGWSPTIAGSSGKTYRARVCATNWFTVSGSEKWTESNDKEVPKITPSDQPVLEEWTFKKPDGKTGINTFAIPFVIDSKKPITLSDGSNLDADGNGKITVGELILAINKQAGSAVVSVFGIYDEIHQEHVGLTKIAYSANLAIDEANTTATGKDYHGAAPVNFTVSDILTKKLISKNKPMQVSVNTEKTFSLTGYK